jgi:predicted ATPase/class 3 adenylate cyclase
VSGPRTVALLFTDIVGSTPLLASAGSSYPRLLVRHRELLSAAVRRHEGAMSAREGDGCLATFASPSAAVAAAVAGQRALDEEPWPDGLAVRVRMLVHHGEVVDLAGEPVGLALHHAARMLSCAGAGDVLVSTEAAQLVSPADGVELVDAGTHRLRDLPRPVRLLRVAAPGLPVPGPTGPSVPADGLVGRDREVAAVAGALATHRLVTITGPGGSGKTRLAQAVAERWHAGGPESPCWVDLAGLSDPTLVPAAALSAMTGERVEGDPLVVLTRMLGRRRALVVLDNCEHVAAGVVPVVEAVARSCPDVRLLATSRARLGCAGEAERQLAPLGVPDAAAVAAGDPAALAGYPGVELFAMRAADVRPGFRLSADNVREVAALCGRLGGLPLAIELAAARLRLFTLAQLGERLGDLDVLGGGSGRPSRQRTMRATIDWSHDLLGPEEQAAFRRLSVFAGGFGLDAAEALLDHMGMPEPDRALEELLANGLVLADLDEDDPRFTMLEPVRQYAEERLDAAGERARAYEAHGRWALVFAAQARGGYFRDQRAWTHRIGAEQHNLRAAVTRALDADQAARALRIAGPLAIPWLRIGVPDARALLDRALDGATDADDHVRALGYFGAGFLAQNASDYVAASASFRDALALYRSCGGRLGEAWSLAALGNNRPEDPDFAVGCLDQAIDLFRELGDTNGLAWASAFLASRRLRAGDLDGARRQAEVTLAAATEGGVVQPRAEACRLLGEIAWNDGDYDESRRRLEEAVAIHRSVNDRWLEVLVTAELGLLAGTTEDVTGAYEHFARATSLAEEISSPDRLGTVLRCLVPFLWGLGRREDAARLLGGYEVLSPAVPNPSLEPIARDIAESALAAARAEGAELTFGDMIALVRRIVSP